jgi:acetyl-CoA acyltransferase
MSDKPQKPLRGRRVALVEGCRTPFVKAFSEYNGLTSLDLSRLAAKEVLYRAGIRPTEVDQVVWSTTVPTLSYPNLGREVAIALGLPKVPGFTVMRACASGLQALTSAAEHIIVGHSETALVGGADSLSNTPVPYTKKVIDALQGFARARSIGAKLRALSELPASELLPSPPDLTEYSTGLTMGQHAERMAKLNGITREAQDDYAFLTHKRAAEATADGRLTAELVPVALPPKFDQLVAEDNMIRKDPDRDKLRALKPVFDRKYGTITAGNASPLTDGAAAVVAMSEERAKALGLKPLGYIRSYGYVALEPRQQLLLGPAYVAPLALDRAGLALADMDLVDMHEAFAAQVLSCLQKMGSKEFASQELGRSEAIGDVDMDRFNVCGGSIPIGHPFGATGLRMVTTALHELNRRGGQFALLLICAGGAMGAGMVLERE